MTAARCVIGTFLKPSIIIVIMKRFTEHTINRFLDTDLTPYEYRFSDRVMLEWLNTQTGHRYEFNLEFTRGFRQEIWERIWPEVQRNDWIRWRVGSMENKAIRHWLKARGNTSKHILLAMKAHGYNYHPTLHNYRPSDHENMRSYMASSILGNEWRIKNPLLVPFDKVNAIW